MNRKRELFRPRLSVVLLEKRLQGLSLLTNNRGASDMLLPGLAVQLHPPPPLEPPEIFTSIAYSTLTRRIQAKEVPAVSIEGDIFDGLLARQGHQRSASDSRDPTTGRASEIAVFPGCVPSCECGCELDRDTASAKVILDLGRKALSGRTDPTPGA